MHVTTAGELRYPNQSVQFFETQGPTILEL